MSTQQNIEQEQDVRIVARFGGSYRYRRVLIFLLFMGFGVWCVRDGFFVWPKDNAEAAARNEKLPHPDWDVPMNRALGVMLPPLSLLLLFWAFYNSRGEYRLEGDTLHVPGHPPIPLDSMIRILDPEKWNKKGLTRIEYQLPGADRPARFKLDDFVYQREPTDRIYEIIHQRLNPVEAAMEEGEQPVEKTEEA